MGKRRYKKIPFDVVAKAYRDNLGNVTLTCKQLNIDYNTFKAWQRDFPEFEKLIEESENTNLDFAESKLFQAINDDNLTAVIFYLKTKGKKRGYIEGQDIRTVISSEKNLSLEEASLFIKDLEKNC